MAFVVEDGTGLPDANAGASLAEVDAYHSTRGNAAWTGSDDVKQQAIIRATDYIELIDSSKFRGCPEFEVQRLSFPRLYLVDRYGRSITGIPEKYKNAIAEYALRALSGSLLQDPVTDERGLLVTSFSEEIGPIKEATTYAVQALTQSYPAADLYLQDFLIPGGRVIRA